MLSDIKKRTITGVIIFIAIVGFIALRYLSTFFFDAFVMLITFASVYEVVQINIKENQNNNAYIILSISFVYVSYLAFLFADTAYYLFIYLLCLFAIYFIVSMTIELIHYKKHRDDEKYSNESHLLVTTLTLFSTLLYPTLLLSSLYGINRFSVPLGTLALALVFGVTIFTDVFAYIFGCTIRGPKLIPQISPNKSISGACFGLLGGLLFSGIALWLGYFENILNIYFGNYNRTLVIIFFVLSGILGSIMTQFGDLLESSIKRKNKIKDFGNIFPGHGGVMDRVDGLMFTSSLIYILMLITF